MPLSPVRETSTTAKVVPLEDAKLYTFDDNFDPQMLDENIQVDSEEFADLFVDELQALNTALCFLCSINADAKEVQAFLRHHPESLLLEGACLLPEDSAVYILRQHMRRCKCKGLCNLNRVRVLGLLNSGFSTFQGKRSNRAEQDAKAWDLYFGKLVDVEHEVRRLRREELMMRNTLAETAFEVRTYREELFELYRNLESKESRSSALMKLACTRPRTSGNFHDGGRRNVLEYQVSVASINLKSVEREHAAVLQRIREGRRAQFSILKRAFQGCKRHEICNINTPPPPAPSASSASSASSYDSGIPSAQSTSGSGESDSFAADSLSGGN